MPEDTTKTTTAPIDEKSNLPLGDTDFYDNLKDIMSKYWHYGLAATLGTGLLSGGIAYFNKPKNETPRQRRRRLLRAFLLPTAATGLGSLAAAIGGAAYNMKKYTPQSAAYKDKRDAIVKYIKEGGKFKKDERDLMETAKDVVPGAIGGAGAGLLNSTVKGLKEYKNERLAELEAAKNNNKETVLKRKIQKRDDLLSKSKDMSLSRHERALAKLKAKKINPYKSLSRANKKSAILWGLSNLWPGTWIDKVNPYATLKSTVSLGLLGSSAKGTWDHYNPPTHYRDLDSNNIDDYMQNITDAETNKLFSMLPEEYKK